MSSLKLRTVLLHKKRCYERLAEEWNVARGFIDIYNLWSETELRDMANGSQEPAGLPLLESGGGNGEGFFMTKIH